MTGPTATTTEDSLTPLQHDLITMLEAARQAEHDLFGRLQEGGAGATLIGEEGWSALDVRSHVAAWRAVEARRLLGRVEHDDPQPADPVDEANARIRAERADWTAEQVSDEADASIHALVEAIRASSTDALCECDRLAAGIGANGVNHALGHLSDIARAADDEERFAEFSAQVEGILHRGHLMPRDSGVMLYNIACHNALIGRIDEARRLLSAAFARHGELREFARDDPDLESLGDELATL